MRLIKSLFVLLYFLSFSLKAQESNLYFVKNKGQVDHEVLSYIDLVNGKLYISKNQLHWVHWDGEVLKKYHDTKIQPDSIKQHYLKATFRNSNFASKIEYQKILPYYNNYFSNEGTFSKVELHQELYINEIYKKIDLRYKVSGSQFKYDFIIQPGGNSKEIEIEYEGAKSISITNKGNLSIKTSIGELTELAPIAYYETENGNIPVSCNFILNKNIIKFQFSEKLNPDLKLVIDPILVFSSYSQSQADNWGFTATYDRDGNLFGGGNVYAPSSGSNKNFPVTPGAFQTLFAGGSEDIVITKYPSNGGLTRLYSTFLGGSGFDNVMSLLTDHDGNLLVLAKTNSTDFPIHTNAYQNSNSGNFDIAVVKLSENGDRLLAGTYLGGTDNDGHNDFGTQNYNSLSLNYNYGDYCRSDIGIDTSGNIIVVSHSKSINFPTTSNAFQKNKGSAQDAVVFKFSPDLKTLIWSSYFGGNGNDAGFGLYIEKNGDILVTGGTTSTDLTVINGFQSSNLGGVDSYISRISSDGSTILSSSYFGTSQYDQSYFIQEDLDGNVYIVGQTEGVITPSAGIYSNTDGKQFFLKIKNDLSAVLLKSIFGNGSLDGNNLPELSPSAFLVDKCNRIYFCGWGGAVNSVTRNGADKPYLGNTRFLQTTNNGFKRTTDGSDFYLLVLEADFASILYGSYFGGPTSAEHVDGGTSRFDPKGVVYQCVCAGCGGNSDFPVTDGSTNLSSNCNMAVFKLDFQLGPAHADFKAIPKKSVGCAPFQVRFKNLSTPNLVYSWNFGDSSATNNSSNPSHIYKKPGLYTVKLFVKDTVNCVRIDSTELTVTVLSAPKATIDTPGVVCSGFNAIVNVKTDSLDRPTFTWMAHPFLVSSNGPTATFKPLKDTTVYVIVSNSACSDTLSTRLTVLKNEDIFIVPDSTVCIGQPFQIKTNILNLTKIKSWRWIKHQGLSDTLNPNPIATIFKPEDFIIQITTLDDCKLTDTLKMKTKFGFNTVSDTDKSICEGSKTIIHAYNGFKWIWNTGDTTQKITVTPPKTTLYWVQAIQPTGCYGSPDSITIDINDIRARFVADYDTGVAPQTIYFTNLSTKATNYEWYDHNNKLFSKEVNAFYRYNALGKFKITLIAINKLTGCRDTMSKEIFMDSILLVLPNVFSPTNDKINDTFFAVYKNIKEFNIKIFSRWGELIFESDDKNFIWDGTYNSQPVQIGGYNFVVKALALNGAPINLFGFVSVLR